MAEKRNIIRPFEGFQEKFVRSNLDLVIGGGAVAAGKSSAAVLCIAEPSLDPKFRAVFLRNNLGDLKSGGGILDEFKKIYGSYSTVKAVRLRESNGTNEKKEDENASRRTVHENCI